MGQECGSVTQRWPNVHKVLGSNPRTVTNNSSDNNNKMCYIHAPTLQKVNIIY